MGAGDSTPDIGGGSIDLAETTDINQLKALAYDRIVSLQLIQNDLQVINERINQLQMPAMSNGKLPD